MAAASFWAAWSRHSAVLPALAEQMGRPIGTIAGQEAANDAKQILEDAGVYASIDGKTSYTKEAAELWQTTRWSEERTAEQLLDRRDPADPQPRQQLGKLWRALEAQSAATLWAKLDDHDRSTWYDGGGHGAGSVWTAAQHTAGTPQAPVWYASAQFVIATAARTLAFGLPPTATCRLPAARTNDNDADDHDEVDRTR